MGVVARTTWEGPKIEAQTYDAVEAALLAAGSEVQTQMQRNIAAKKGPSAPGEFPGYDTRNLTLSVTTERMAPDRVRMGSPVFYGRLLEYGTSKMAARPWVVRSFMMAKERAKARFDSTMRRLLGGGDRHG